MSTDYNTRAAKGQALNLAVADYLNHQRHNLLKVELDINYILNRYVEYYKLSELVQSATVDEINDIIKEKDKT